MALCRPVSEGPLGHFEKRQEASLDIATEEEVPGELWTWEEGTNPGEVERCWEMAGFALVSARDGSPAGHVQAGFFAQEL